MCQHTNKKRVFTRSDYYLSEDLISQILFRLPVKSLLRFRSISKSICYMIENPNFIRMRAFQSPKRVIFRHRHLDEIEKAFEDFCTSHSDDELPLDGSLSRYTGIPILKFPVSGFDFDIVGSCNGILCLFGSRTGISLWNPSIKRKLTLPYHPSWLDTFESYKTAVGFGYEQITHDYKVLTITSPVSRQNTQSHSILVYSTNLGSWNEIAPPRILFTHVISRACFINGRLHWVVKHYLSESDETGHLFILTFDLSTHAFGKILLPEPSWETRHLAIINGSLAVISTQNKLNLFWVLNEYNKPTSWSEFFKLETDSDSEVGKVLQLTNGDLLFNTFHHSSNCEFYMWHHVYNPRTQGRSKIMFYDSCHIEDMEMCPESLELFGMGTFWDGKQPYCLGGEATLGVVERLNWIDSSLLKPDQMQRIFS